MTDMRNQLTNISERLSQQEHLNIDRLITLFGEDKAQHFVGQ